MKIGNDEITTPREDNIGYDRDWRFRIADAHVSSGEPLPEAVSQDAAIQALLACLQGKPKQDAGCLGAMSARASPTMGRVLDAYLLTRASASQILEETGIPNGAIDFYERLFFNVRTFCGDPRQSQVLRLAMELESSPEPTTPAERIHRAMMKAAIDGDVHLLRTFIPRRRAGVSQGSFAGTLVQRELNRRILRGELSTSALIKLRGLEIAEDRMNLSMNKSGTPDLHNDNNYYAGDPYVLSARTF